MLASELNERLYIETDELDDDVEVYATTPHGTYTFRIEDLTVNPRQNVMLQLVEVKGP